MIIGHQFQLNYLKKLAESDKIPHALLFSGEDKIGKKKAAFEFASILLECNAEKVKSNPDFLFVEPVSNKGKRDKIQKKEIKIAKVREISSHFSLGTFSSPFKVAVIDDAHLMRKDAQSSFLKLLEEPKGSSLFYRVSDEKILKYLKNTNFSEKEKKEIVDLSQGKPGKAYNFISNPEKLKEEKQRIKEIIKMVNSDIDTRFKYAEEISKDPNKLKEILNLWLEYFRKALIKKSRGKTSGKYTLKEVEKILKLIQNLKSIVSSTNVNPRLAFEILMIEL
jgi:DNA polymerase-3 subunit delta'